MKTREEEIAFAEELLRLTNEYGDAVAASFDFTDPKSSRQYIDRVHQTGATMNKFIDEYSDPT